MKIRLNAVVIHTRHDCSNYTYDTKAYIKVQ